MWFIEEVLVPQLQELSTLLGPDRTFSLLTPPKGFERSLLEGSVDFVVACHPPENPEIEHKQVNEEGWAVIAPYRWKKTLATSQEEMLDALKKRAFIRHADMNLDLFLPNFTTEILNSSLTIDSLVGVRSAVVEEMGWSFVPRPAVSRYFERKLLYEVPVKLDLLNRKVSVWWLRNRYDSKRIAGKVCLWAKGWKLSS